MTKNPETSSILICVAIADPVAVTDLLVTALRDAGIAVRLEQVTSLGQSGNVSAADYALPVTDAATKRKLVQAISEQGADAAILPSAARRKRLLISDMDSTIIGQECLDELADFAGFKAEVSAITERAMRGELDFETALTTRVSMLKGLGLDALEAAYKERITLNPGARQLVTTMKVHGAATILVSGGFTFFTARVADAAGFDQHRGNILIDDGKALTGDVGRPILGREAKLAALDEFAARAGLSRADTLALGDGANDLAMIRASGLGIAYEAKPIVAAEAHAAINHTDLRAALFFQGYTAEEFSAG
mgnify:CR=1 FL=1